MITDLFIGLDNPEQRQYNLSTISSIDNKRTLDDVLKYLSIYKQAERISDSDYELIRDTVLSRQAELQEELNAKRNGGNKRMSLTPTSVSNRVGTASIIFLVTNVAITTVMYTLLIISHFLNN